MKRLRFRVTYANVVATLALFIALGGSSYAAVALTGQNIKDNTLTSADIKNNSLTSNDIKDGSLLSKDFKRRPTAERRARSNRRAGR